MCAQQFNPAQFYDQRCNMLSLNDANLDLQPIATSQRKKEANGSGDDEPGSVQMHIGLDFAEQLKTNQVLKSAADAFKQAVKEEFDTP